MQPEPVRRVAAAVLLLGLQKKQDIERLDGMNYPAAVVLLKS